MNEKLRKRLIAEIVWTGVKQGGFQRSRIYKKDSNIREEEKKGLRDHIKEFCFINLYKSQMKISEKELIEIINNLAKSVQEKYKLILNEEELKFGNSQKFVNLYLKLLWVLDQIEEPPHFPVDRLIQRGFKTIRSWTSMSEDEYLEVIKIAKQKAKQKNLTLANWELFEYEKIKNGK